MHHPETRNPAAGHGRVNRENRAERLETKQYDNRPSLATIRARQKEIAKRYAWHADQADQARAGRRPSALLNVRLRDLERVFEHRSFYLQDDDSGRDDLEIAGHHIFHFPGGSFEARFRSWARLWAPWADKTMLNRLASKIERRPLKWMADTLATRLGLAYAVRTGLGVTTIGAIDFGKEQRVKRRHDRNRAAKAAARRAAGAKPQLDSNERKKPWTALGMSKATWYRKGKPAPPAKAVRQLRVQQMETTIGVPETVSIDRSASPPAPVWPAAAFGSVIAGQTRSREIFPRVDGLLREMRS